MVTKGKKIKKGARKKFFQVEVPLTTTKIHLYGYTPEDMENKVIKLDLTKSLRGKGLELKAVVKLKNDKLVGELSSLKLAPSYIKRSMRRVSDYTEDSFEVECKDAKLRIKPFMIARKRVSRKVLKAIREAARKHIETKIKVRTSDEIFSEIMSNKFQKELSLKVKKVYPLALCEIRMLQVLEKIEKKPKAEKKEK
jgi:ribosomal protein S3AE